MLDIETELVGSGIGTNLGAGGTEPLKSALLSKDGMLEAKLLAMAVLGGVAAAIAFLPLGFTSYLDRRNSNGKPETGNRFSFMFPFGGGVLLCTIFLHLLPEVTENVEQLYKLNVLPEMRVALPELLTCCGFFLMLFVDGITHTLLHKFFQTKVSPEPNLGKMSTVQVSQSTPTLPTSKWSQVSEETKVEDTYLTDEVRANVEEPEPNGLDHHHHGNHEHNHDSHTHLDHLIVSKVSLVRCFLFVLALSVHEFFEGLAIGLESKVNAVYFLLAAVASHKLVIALCIGVEMVTARIKFNVACTYIITYSIVSPVGILVGMLVLKDASTGSEVNLIASALLQGIATGTLLYVVFFEVLTKSMGKTETGFLKMIAILLGFLAMLFLQLSLDQDED